jgi:hypothetical protein
MKKKCGALKKNLHKFKRKFEKNIVFVSDFSIFFVATNHILDKTKETILFLTFNRI